MPRVNGMWDRTTPIAIDRIPKWILAAIVWDHSRTALECESCDLLDEILKALRARFDEIIARSPDREPYLNSTFRRVERDLRKEFASR